MSHPQSAGLGRTGTGTSACDHTYPACYAARRTCCSNAALVDGMFSIAENHVPTTLSILHWLNTFCCTRQLYTRNFSVPSRVSELTYTGCRDRSRKASIADGQDLKANLLTFFSVAEAARHSVAPTDSIEEHLCFFH